MIADRPDPDPPTKINGLIGMLKNISIIEIKGSHKIIMAILCCRTNRYFWVTLGYYLSSSISLFSLFSSFSSSSSHRIL